MADVKISELPVGATLTGTEEIPMAQSGATVKMTAQDIADLASPTAGVSSVVAGSGISVDNTDPSNPVISATGGGAVDSVNGQTGVVSLGLADLDDVDAAGAASGDVLTWDNTAGEWVPEAPTGGGGSDRSVVTALSIASGVVNIDCSLGDFFTLTLSANVSSLTFSNLPASGKGCSLAIRIRQDGTGSRTLALPSSFKATGGSDTAVQSAANAYTLLTLTTFDQGTRWEYAMQEIAS